ncbi:phosphogluconate dehydrogenase (NAD(+)-dependent, decarboxylating) [Chlorobium sp. N1]|uniref:phosphogluconate dehydrogenase (NAD(+)-dependent, decarboxylating) n=1 Tax=Chlorobium sp. N1 TaxID=2491138 RepID=UPI00103909ED|nr:decarboxylating 6-phosphogluconate dehydrogenase [Chlorobium sp. N1]TCD47881.1 decarboxylating 6-phosphogluconate dehydrogenase [Chlorobium sp. N1]
MKIGFIGLGKMGFNMASQLLERGHELVVFDLIPSAMDALAEAGAGTAASLGELCSALPSPRIVWMMVPAGEPVEATIAQLEPFLSTGDILIDGGNSRYTDSEARARRLALKGIRFLDAGTSGGLDGARHGACVMVGGEKEAYDAALPLFRDLTVEGGYGYMGPSGSGHFVKMVHNGIEYGMMQAMGEGFALMDASRYGLDLEEVARVWSNGSVIRGWLMELARDAFRRDGSLGYLEGRVADSGEGRWTVESALEHGVSVPVIAASLFSRYRSRDDNAFSDRVVAALRYGFGGHAMTPPKDAEA